MTDKTPFLDTPPFERVGVPARPESAACLVTDGLPMADGTVRAITLCDAHRQPDHHFQMANGDPNAYVATDRTVLLPFPSRSFTLGSRTPDQRRVSNFVAI